MPDVTQFASMADVCSFLACVLGVSMLAYAVFESFPAMELGAWIGRSAARPLAELHRLRFEAANGIKYTPEIARNDPAAVRVPLRPEERDRTRVLVRQRLLVTLPLRAVEFGLACTACHCLAAALILLPLVDGTLGVGNATVNALAYGGGAWVLRWAAPSGAGQKRGGCGSR